MKCPKCGCEETTIKQDSRGVAERRCASCNSYIKKVSTSEVVEFYEGKVKYLQDVIDNLTVKGAPEDSEAITEREPCRWCKEYYFFRLGRTTSYVPIETKYCPICGRELKDTDRDY